jgi:hypothetical protein
MSDNKPKLPHGADTMVLTGSCAVPGQEHAVALKDGKPVAFTTVRRVKDGESLPRNGDVYVVEDGRVIDSMRLGNGPAQVATEAYRTNHERIFGTEAN